MFFTLNPALRDDDQESDDIRESDSTSIEKHLFECCKPQSIQKCHLKVNKGTATAGFYLYNDNDKVEERDLLLYAENIKNFNGTAFSIYLNQLKRDIDLVGTVSSDMKKTIYRIYEYHDHDSIKDWCCTVKHNLNPIGLKGPKTIKVKIPGLKQNYSRYTCKNEKDTEHILRLKSKKPVWNEEHQVYQLNFFDRSSCFSSKNMQLISEKNDNYIILSFCKCEENQYKLDFAYPLNIIQAFGIALTYFKQNINGI